MKLTAQRQILIMAISMLVIATAVGTKAQPCNEKEERKRAQLRKECEKKKIKAEKYWSAFEVAQNDIGEGVRVQIFTFDLHRFR